MNLDRADDISHILNSLDPVYGHLYRKVKVF